MEPLDDHLGEVEQWIEDARNQGVLDSSGKFTLSLADARTKLSQFSQVDPQLWTLKIFQAFQLLGCRHLLVDQEENEWIFRGSSPLQALDPEAVQLDLDHLALTGQNTPEQCLAWALVGLPNVAGARVVGQGLDAALVGRTSLNLSPEPGELCLALAYDGAAPDFPEKLWKARCWPANMSWNYGRGMWSKLRRLAVTQVDSNPDHWLESYHVCASRPSLAAHSQGRAQIDLAPPSLPPRLSHLTSVIRSGDSRAEAGKDLLLLVAPRFAGKGGLHPVQAGVILQSIPLEGLPDGLSVYFAADGLGTDLSQFRLQETPQLAQRRQEVLRALPSLLSPLLQNWRDWGPKLVPLPKTSPVMDAAPALLAGVGALLAVSIPGGVFVGGCCIAPSAAYFKYSRDQRRSEHQRQLSQFESLTEDILAQVQALFRPPG